MLADHQHKLFWLIRRYTTRSDTVFLANDIS